MDKFPSWKEQIARMDVSLRPIAQCPVSTFGILFKSRRAVNPFEAAGVKTQADQLLSELIEHYPAVDAESRQAVRKLFEDHQSFSWAAVLPFAPVTDEAFRAHLILFSIKDQGQDTRDAIIELHELCEKARAAGVKTGPILQEIADLSSDWNKYGMGSTRSLLLNG